MMSQPNVPDVSLTTLLPPLHPSRLQINKHIEQRLHLLPAKRGADEKDVYDVEAKYASNVNGNSNYPSNNDNVPQRVIRIENVDKEKLHELDNNNIENYKYYSQIVTLKKRSILPQIRYDQIMTNNETSLKAAAYHGEEFEDERRGSLLVKAEKMETDNEDEVAYGDEYKMARESSSQQKRATAYDSDSDRTRTSDGEDAATATAVAYAKVTSRSPPAAAEYVDVHQMATNGDECGKDACCERLPMQSGELLMSKDPHAAYDQTSSVRSDEGYHSNGFHDDALTPPDGCVDSDDSDNYILDFR